MSNCTGDLVDISEQDIKQAIQKKGLLTIEIEPSLKCNFKCPYCYVASDNNNVKDLSLNELKDVIVQGKDLGARNIIILGGEPMIYPHIVELIGFINSLGLNSHIFTNGTNISMETADLLFQHGVKPMLKYNSKDKNIQNFLCGRENAFETIQNAFNNLLEAGYSKDGQIKLSVSSIICRQNLHELPDLWRFFKGKNILPYFEIITPGSKNTSDLEVSSSELKKLFQEISEIDRLEFGNTWDPLPPIMGYNCSILKYSCIVKSKGFVMPCVGVSIKIGDIRQKKLKDIIHDSEILHELRNHEDYIKEPCRSCDASPKCYGCRGAAFNLTGDYLAADPLCWRNDERKEEIAYLPFKTEGLIPHLPPMSQIKRILYIGEKIGHVESEIKRDNIFLDSSANLDRCLFVEMVAQAAGALESFKDMKNSPRALKGFLADVSNFEFSGSAGIGDVLKIEITKIVDMDKIALLRGEVFKNKELIASGNIKLFRENG